MGIIAVAQVTSCMLRAYNLEEQGSACSSSSTFTVLEPRKKMGVCLTCNVARWPWVRSGSNPLPLRTPHSAMDRSVREVRFDSESCLEGGE
jgi:hypothetical protein